MAKKNITPSYGRSGMNKDVHFSALKEGEYTHAKNTNFSNESGNAWLIQNEHSNILASKFKSNYVVVGYKNDIFLNRTFYFLHNPIDNLSEIGVIEQTQSFDENNTLTYEHQNYKTLLSDSCLNFSLDKPIKTIEIHSEKLGTVIYWTDNLNPPRFLNIDKLADYIEDGELNCEKLKMFRAPKVPSIEPLEIVLGGRLKRGVYQAILTYCDILGNEQSRYFSLTNPISIFDERNNILDQKDIANETGYAIKLKINNLDTTFTHYKVVFIQQNDVNSSTTYIEEGIHSTSDDTIIFDTDKNKEKSTPDALAAPAIIIDRVAQLKEINNTLFLNGITNKKVPNLQKVINLLGIYLQWQSYVANEDLYKDGVSSAKYKGYFRDEVTPLSIRFIREGDYTPNYPLIGRPLKRGEDDIITGGKDVESFNKIGGSTLINKKWQLYNTATKNGTICQSGIEDIEYQEIIEEVTKVTNVLGIGEINNGNFVLSLENGESFTDLRSYLNENIEELSGLSSLELNNSLADLVKLFDLSESFNQVNVFPEYDDNLIDTETGETLIDSQTGLPVKACEQVNNTNFSNYLQEQRIEIASVENENLNFIPFEFPDEYPRARIQTQNPCDLFTDPSLVGWSGKSRIFERIQGITENSCRTATLLNLTNNTREVFFPTESFSYYGGLLPVSQTGVPEEDYKDVLTNKVASTVGAPPSPDSFGDKIFFTNRIAKNAAWYEYAPTEKEDTFILNLSKSVYRRKDRLGNGDIYRISIYTSCNNNSEPIFHDFFKSKQGILIKFKKELNILKITSDQGKEENIIISPSKYYIAVENGILEFRGGVDYNSEGKAKDIVDQYTDNQNQDKNPDYIALGSQGCYSLNIIPEQFKEVEVEFDKITTDKTQTWSSPCKFNIPNLTSNTSAIPYQTGEFAYTESLEKYPDNKELFDSSVLEITPQDFSEGIIPQESGSITFREFFESNYTNGQQNGKYILKESTDFTRKNIRHFKFPDNNISPFITSQRTAPFAQSLIYPLGITINENIINDFLNIAVKNKLITQEQKDEIKGYEILRGERDADKSVIARGIVFDLYKYTEKNREVHYANYPFNSLGRDIMHYKDDVERVDSNLINHPYNSQKNYAWTFHSPDTDYNFNTSPATYMKVEGYLYGKSEANIDIVRDHPKYTILGRRLRRLARRLATLEIIAESTAQLADITSRTWFVGGVSTGGNLAAPIVAGGLTIFSTIVGAIFKHSRYRYEWLETFRNLGKRRDFAYFMTSHGYYNYFAPNTLENNTLRYLNVNTNLNEGRYTYTDSVGGSRLEINNIDREKTTVLSVGEPTSEEDFTISYSTDFINYDNTDANKNLASKTYNSIDGTCDTGRSDTIRSNVASMYVTLKNYLPSQYGNIGSVKWVSTGYAGDLENPKEGCFGIFGGDCFITRHTFRRGFPFFNTTAMRQSDMTPFEYKFYTNIGKEPRFYLNFGIDTDEREGGRLFPFNNSEYNLDCVDDRGSYVKEPSKFYLEYNGIPNFLVESTINTWNRYAKAEPWNNFYPNFGDKIEWTQPDTNPSRRGNTFFYNKNYSSPPLRLFQNVLPIDYNQEDFDKTTDAPNGTRYSLPDNSENESINPWLIFRPSEFYEFKTSYGKLTGMTELDSGAVLVTFENTSVVFNAVDQTTDDGQNPSTQNLGTSSIFLRRPKTVAETELGYLGNQNFQILRTPAGHVFVDAKRGQVFLKRIGGNFEEISRASGDQPSGMRAWFKEELPYKILNYAPNYDIDNPYNGVGITMGFDSRYNRIFITKRDYEPTDISQYCLGNGLIYTEEGKQEVIDTYESLDYTYKGIQDCQLIFEKLKEFNLSNTDIFAIFDTSGSFNGQGLTDLRNAMQSFIDNSPDFNGNYYPIDSRSERWLGNTSFISQTYAGQDLSTKNVLYISFCNEASPDYHFESNNLTQNQISNYIRDYDNFKSLYSSLKSFKGISYPVITTGASGSGSSYFALQGSYLVLQNLYAYYGFNISEQEADSIKVNSYFTQELWDEFKNSLLNNNPYNVEGLKNFNWDMKTDSNDLSGSVIDEGEFIADLNEYLFTTTTETEVVKVDLKQPSIEEFKDVSWTVAYSLDAGKWISFYDFKPNFYVNHNDYFQTGVNTTNNNFKKGLWTHLLNNKSYQTFYGETFDWEIELPIENKQVNKYLQSFAYRLNSRKYLTETEYHQNKDLGFDKVFIYNDTNATGKLKLDLQRTLRQLSQYPILEGDTQRILQSQQDGIFRFNYFYNRVKDESLVKSLIKYDENYIDRELNNDVVSFTGKRTLERMRGTYFLVNLRSSETEHKKILELSLMAENIYDK